ncbi:hypothetical protein H4R99_008342 [Coemansia sp. RSA 1722]|nr:hypothetical protein LPJ57_003375 [Coemansia sp. RSA 486]KAJ2237337.1 hypothetical protein IWW45_001023 [Coemansia sp. RSA 485]KAJ2586825.1 hypothetical protein H4R99_008342 [Coemansia sp. RSA 1722]
MVHRHKSTLPQWYAESKFLETEATSKLSDQTLNYTFGHLFQTPDNPHYHNGNQLQINFCHLEFPWDCTGALADPPLDIPGILRKLSPHTARCIVDCTLKEAVDVDRLLKGFEKAGYKCDRGLVDHVMCLDLQKQPIPIAAKQGHLANAGELDALVRCNQRCFGYEDAGWLRIKLQRELDQQEWFRVFAITDGNGDIGAFAVTFVPVEKAPDLALVHVVGTVPECRRRGLASAVLSTAIAGLPTSVSRVYLQACDPAAISLYNKLGFEEVGKTITAECYMVPSENQ